MLIRDNKISIKDSFSGDRRSEGQTVEGGRQAESRWKGRGWGVHSGLCHRVDYTTDTSFRPSDCVHFNSPVTPSYNTTHWLFEQTRLQECLPCSMTGSSES